VVHHFKQRLGGQIYRVVLSGDDDESLRARCREAGADAVIAKPTSPTALRGCLAAGLDAIRAAA